MALQPATQTQPEDCSTATGAGRERLAGCRTAPSPDRSQPAGRRTATRPGRQRAAGRRMRRRPSCLRLSLLRTRRRPCSLKVRGLCTRQQPGRPRPRGPCTAQVTRCGSIQSELPTRLGHRTFTPPLDVPTPPAEASPKSRRCALTALTRRFPGYWGRDSGWMGSCEAGRGVLC